MKSMDATSSRDDRRPSRPLSAVPRSHLLQYLRVLLPAAPRASFACPASHSLGLWPKHLCGAIEGKIFQTCRKICSTAPFPAQYYILGAGRIEQLCGRGGPNHGRTGRRAARDHVDDNAAAVGEEEDEAEHAADEEDGEPDGAGLGGGAAAALLARLGGHFGRGWE